MKHGQASRTAFGAAGHRAAHQRLEGGFVFADPMALRILGDEAEEAIARATAAPEQRPLRIFIAMRSRFAEDAAKAAVAAGVRQIVVLGAGLDTFAYRFEPPPDLRLFELDHPATQAEKRRRLAAAGIREPPHAVYVSHDFDLGSFTAALAAAGHDAGAPTFVMWLGVTEYLTETAIEATLAELARLPGGAEIVFDYVNPRAAIEDGESRRALAARVAELGEPFRGALDTAALHERALALGFVAIEDLDRAALAARYLPHVPPPKPGPGGHIVRMATL